MSLNDIIQIDVTQVAPGISAAGFGTPLVLSYNASFVGRTKSYTSAAEVAVDYPTLYSAERLCLNAMFAQSPAPKVIKVGKCLLKPTMRYKISAITPTSFASTEYKLIVKGASYNQTVTFTSDASPTDAEWAAAAVAALNAVVGKNYTASGASSPISVTATNPGDFVSIEVTNRSLMSLEVDHADPGIATDLANIALEDSDFFSLVPTQFSDAMIASAAAWALTNKRLFLFSTPNTKAVTTVVGTGTDPIDAVKTVGNRFASGWFHPSPADFLTAAVNARCLPTDPGSETWFAKQLEGVSPVVLTPTERANLVAKYGNSYEDIRGVRITFDGRVSNGSYIDIQRGLLWLIDTIQVDFFNFTVAASAAGKVGFDQQGRAALLSVYRSAMKKGIARGFVADGSVEITMLEVIDVPSGDKANRHYPDTTIAFTALGAIQSADVSLVMSV